MAARVSFPQEFPAMLDRCRRPLPVLAALLALALAGPARACPFCSMQGQTLTGEVAQASMVLYGSLANARATEQTTDLVIETVIKDHSARAGRKVLTLERYVEPPRDGKHKVLAFLDVFKNKVDPYRG